MPSKGVQCYSYVCVPGCQIEFSVPGTTIVRNTQRQYISDHLEVDKKNIKGPFNFSGTFSFRVTQNGNEIANEKISINVLTGNLEGGTLKTMANQASIVRNDVIVSYGYYDAGPGVAGLPNRDQCYVTPFSKLFLPAAHDIGMNSMQSSDAVISSDALVNVLTTIDPVFAKIANMMAHPAVMAIAPNIVRGLAITQKDTLPAILAIGARYFEFRPAYLHNVIRGKTAIPDVLYFSHSAIPGMPFAEFLSDVVKFLVAHPDEIVVTQLRWDGVPAECAHPSNEDIGRYISTALAPTNGSIVQGSLDDMLRLSIADLRAQKKRLILFTPSDSFSTYTDAANATLTGDSIIAEFNAITPEKQRGKPFTNLQCQATATNVPEAVAYSVLAANASSSCLLATKPICDAKTLPWIQGNGGRLDGGQLVVVMNDFLEGATADVCVEWCRRRLA
ncbi:PLC-like phosphodiesterase [Cadophora sp. MPI-SDFR-AT-0126]|nr:PLC-like phosphodiesterase [Leotiomycetes sp. MPI-SDFR-AT-0126]